MKLKIFIIENMIYIREKEIVLNCFLMFESFILLTRDKKRKRLESRYIILLFLMHSIHLYLKPIEEWMIYFCKLLI